MFPGDLSCSPFPRPASLHAPSHFSTLWPRSYRAVPPFPCRSPVSPLPGHFGRPILPHSVSYPSRPKRKRKHGPRSHSGLASGAVRVGVHQRQEEEGKNAERKDGRREVEVVHSPQSPSSVIVIVVARVVVTVVVVAIVVVAVAVPFLRNYFYCYYYCYLLLPPPPPTPPHPTPMRSLVISSRWLVRPPVRSIVVPVLSCRQRPWRPL